VEAWRGSGQSAAKFAAARGFSSASLLRWASEREAPPAGPGGGFVRLEVVATAAAELTVEVGGARVVVRRGFDRVLLREVVGALSGPESA